MDKISRKRIQSLLKGTLPGSSAHIRMAPESRPVLSDAIACRDAAVMLLIYPELNLLKMVFIKRNEYDGPHSGQVSFPGGMTEDEDRDMAYTALRETVEETGVSASEIEVLGALSSLYIPVSNFCVHPFIGWSESTPRFHPDSSEVQYLICPTLHNLLDPDNRKSGMISVGNRKIRGPYFELEGEIIWGATAMILNEFIEITGY